MMKKYLETKEEYRDCILFYRLGDFYEMFFDDAIMVSRELELTLTGKDCGQEERAPMCGVPFHAAETYINRLVANGHKVAICEQVEDPKLAKGLVRREVIRIVTPGTNLDTQALDATKNNYLMAVVYVSGRFGISCADITTGEFLVTEAETERKITDEILRYSPAEIICNRSLQISPLNLDELKERLSVSVFELDDWYFDDDTCTGKLRSQFHVSTLSGLGLEDYPVGTIAAGALLLYLTETQKSELTNFTGITPYSSGRYMVLDTATRRNLELCETLREKQKRGTLLWVLDKTKTAMGARMLRSFVEQPLIDADEIIRRQDAIEELQANAIVREELREYLNPVYDLERLISRISYRSANPRDMRAFKTSLEMVPPIKYILGSFQAPLIVKLRDELDELKDISDLIGRAIEEDPPMGLREGGFIKSGYNEEVDTLRKAKTEGKQWLTDVETREREKTGIKNLRIRYNKVFGYYLEVTNSYRDLVPDYFTRKQTLTNAERYITPELKELEDMILGAEDKLFSL
ncbi:MAG: DNA mismatch repair protein MutS, partial [Lachnospiraceae bacterium]|nr:DNA mismatch repair protein MutS [Lachnospiraceae bacterium]